MTKELFNLPHHFFKQWPVGVLVCWLGAMLVATFFGEQANDIALNAILHSPNWQHWLGCDDLGRDIALRVAVGAKVSLTVATVVTIVTFSLGTTVGLVSGFYGGWLDRLLMRITDVFLAFPGLLLAIALAAVLGPGLNNLLLALVVTSWVGYARLARAQSLSLRQRQHVLAAESLGASVPRLLLKHMLPLLMAPLLVEATYGMASLVIAEASLSFLGLGVQAPNASWGGMLKDGVRYLLVAPHYVVFVGLSLMSLVLAINVLGDRLRDQWDIRR